MKIVYEVHYYFVKVSRKEIPRLTSALGVPLDTRIQLVEFFLSRGIHKKRLKKVNIATVLRFFDPTIILESGAKFC